MILEQYAIYLYYKFLIDFNCCLIQHNYKIKLSDKNIIIFTAYGLNMSDRE